MERGLRDLEEEIQMLIQRGFEYWRARGGDEANGGVPEPF